MTLCQATLESLPRWRYAGSPESPYPPFDDSWREASAQDADARAGAASLLGALPVNEYADVVLPSGGLYRFFAFELASGGVSIGALQFVGDCAGTLGADPSVNGALDQAQKDLDTQKAGAQAVTDSYVTGDPPDYPSAVGAYQAIGTAAVSSTGIGGEIDSAGVANVTQPYTQQAWQLNVQLAQIDASSAAEADAQNAGALLGQMFALFQQAINAGRNAQPPASGGGGGGAPAGGFAPSSQLVTLAHNLLATLTANGCVPRFVQAVKDFQAQFDSEVPVNASIGTDGYYGGDTQGALQAVLDASGGGASAPAGCVGPAKPLAGGGAAGGGAGTTPSPSQASAASSSSGTGTAVAIGAALLGLTGIIITAATGYIPNPFK